MKFREKCLLTLLFIVGEMKYNFVLGVVGIKRPIKNYKQARAGYSGEHIGGNNADFYRRRFALNQQSHRQKYQIF